MQATRERIVRIVQSLGAISPSGRLAMAILGAALCVVGLIAIGSAFAARPNYPADTDLWIYLRAADALQLNPYHPEINVNFDRYGYPPLLAELIGGLKTIFGQDALLWLWPSACVAALVGAIVLLARGFGVKLHWSLILLAVGFVIMGRIVRSDVVQGQVNVFVLLLLAGGLVLRTQGRVIAAAVAFGVMMSLKPFIGVVVLYFAMRGDWRMARWALGVGALVFAASFLPFGLKALEAFTGWKDATHYFTSPPFVTKPDNQSAYGMALRMFTPTEYATPWINSPQLVPAFMSMAITLAAALAMTGLWLDKRQHGPRKQPEPAVMLLECSMIIALTMFAGPLTEGNHMVVMLAGFAGALIVGLQRVAAGSSHWRLWLAVIAAWALPAFFVIFPRILPFAYGLHQYWHDIEGLQVLLSGRSGLLLLLAGGLTAIALWQERRSEVPALQPGRIRLAAAWRREARN